MTDTNVALILERCPDYSAEYAAALAAHNVAHGAYEIVRNAYRAGTVDDATFLSARRAYDVAGAIFDAAYAREAGWEDA